MAILGHGTPDRSSPGPSGLSWYSAQSFLQRAHAEGFLISSVNSRKQKNVSATPATASAGQLRIPTFSQSFGRTVTTHCPSISMQQWLPHSPRACVSFYSPYLSVKAGAFAWRMLYVIMTTLLEAAECRKYRVASGRTFWPPPR